MFECRDGLGVTFEPLHEGRVGRDVLGEDLHPHFPSDVRLDRAEHRPAAAFVDLLQ